jgi:ATP-binding cassette subfamily C (CFTR/MRP) protein 1
VLCPYLARSPLWKALFVAYGGPFAIAAGLKVTQDLLAFLQPQLLRWLLSYISVYQDARFSPGSRPSKAEGFVIPLIMFFASIVQTICINQVIRTRPRIQFADQTLV